MLRAVAASARGGGVESLGIAEPHAHQGGGRRRPSGLDAALAASAARYGWQGRIEAHLSLMRWEAPTPARRRREEHRQRRARDLATGTAWARPQYLMPTWTIYRVSCGAGELPTSAYSGAENPHRANVLHFAGEGTLRRPTHRPHLLQPTRTHAASYDLRHPTGERRWIREYANFILTTPDMLNYST